MRSKVVNSLSISTLLQGLHEEQSGEQLVHLNLLQGLHEEQSGEQLVHLNLLQDCTSPKTASTPTTL